MAHSFMTYRGHRRRMHETDSIVSSRLAIDVVERRSMAEALTDNVRAMIERWRSLTDRHGVGIVDLELDRFVRTEPDRHASIAVLRATRDFVRGRGATLDRAYLNRLINAPDVLWFDLDYASAHVERALEELIELLETPSADERQSNARAPQLES